MRHNLDDRQIDWRVIDGVLERSVVLPDCRSYKHRCLRATFERAAEYIDYHAGEGLTMDSIALAIDAPYTQVNVAFELLKERSILETDGRKSYVVAGYREGFYGHAMTEYLALEAGMPPQLRHAQEQAGLVLRSEALLRRAGKEDEGDR